MLPKVLKSVTTATVPCKYQLKLKIKFKEPPLVMKESLLVP